MTTASGIGGSQPRHRRQLRGARDPHDGFLALNRAKGGFKPFEVANARISPAGGRLLVAPTVRRRGLE
jgi:hypothetical protein